MHFKTALAAAFVVSTATTAHADFTPEAEVCIEALIKRVGQTGGEVLGQQFSEAATQVQLRDASGVEWDCIVWSGPTVADLRPVGGEASADDGGGAMDGADRDRADRAPREMRVQFAAGTSGAQYDHRLRPGASRKYILGASDGQFMNVTIDPRRDRLEYQIFNPDGSFLLDMIEAEKPYSGQLWQTGDHVVEVINRGDRAVRYDVSFGIE